MTIEDLCGKYHHIPIMPRTQININLIRPKNRLILSESNVDTINELMELVHSLHLNKFEWTPSGGISKKKGSLRLPAYATRYYKTQVDIVLLLREGQFLFSIGLHGTEEEEKAHQNVYGKDAWDIFIRTCAQFNLNIGAFAISKEEGLKVKESIPSPLIRMERDSYCGYDHVYTNVHHIDFNSSHMSGVAEAFPPLMAPIEYMYERRHAEPIFKKVLVILWGYFQSQWLDYAYAHLSKAGLERTNRCVLQVANELKSSGRKVLAYNTDGIWYQGDRYMSLDEGPLLGQWKHDHTNCTIRFKSAGAYEYIENGNYFPVVRGQTRLDRIKSREDWTWGDIWRTDATPIKFYWNAEKEVFEKQEDGN